MELIIQSLLVAVEMLVLMVQIHLYRVQGLQQLLQLAAVKVELALLLMLLQAEVVVVVMVMVLKILVRQELQIKDTLAVTVQV